MLPHVRIVQKIQDITSVWKPVETNHPAPIKYLVASYVLETPGGPLSLTVVNDSSIKIVTVLFGQEEIRLKLASGATVETVHRQAKPLQLTVIEFPLNTLREISWFEGRSDVTFRYASDGKYKKATTHVAAATDRVGFLEYLQSRFDRPFQTEQARAGILQVAWSNLLGAVLSLVGTIWIYASWDPAQLARIRHGRLALAIGREGCAAIGLAIFVGCCIYGWLAVRKHAHRFRCIIP
jgi:hypothetical protein